jgi:hypothetical protein
MLAMVREFNLNVTAILSDPDWICELSINDFSGPPGRNYCIAAAGEFPKPFLPRQKSCLT